MALQKFLNASTLDDEGKLHIMERHVNEWSGKSRFVMEKDEVFRIVEDVIKEARAMGMVEACYTDKSGMNLKTVILRKVFDKDLGVNCYGKVVRSVYVILRDKRVVTAFPAETSRTHNGLYRKTEKDYEEDYEQDYEQDYEEQEEDDKEEGGDKDYDEDKDPVYESRFEIVDYEELIFEKLWA